MDLAHAAGDASAPVSSTREGEIRMNRSILLGLSAMIMMVGCADLEQPDAVPDSSQYQVISRGGVPVDVESRDGSPGSLEPSAPNSGPGAPSGCRAGDFCGYSGFNGTGTRVFRIPGESTQSFPGVFSVFNNGNRQPGFDHVQVDWIWFDGTHDTRCIHYNPGPGVFAVNFEIAPVTITRIHWRGECKPGEDV
jgi:hypothetical protein